MVICGDRCVRVDANNPRIAAEKARDHFIAEGVTGITGHTVMGVIPVGDIMKVQLFPDSESQGL
jgi:hypothetical protein